MDVEDVFQGLADAADTISGLRCFATVPDSITPPVFFPTEVDIDYDQTFRGGLEAYVVTCRVLTSRADTRAGQKLLQGFLKRTGPTSIKAALEATRTQANGALGGVCHDLHVRKASGYGYYEHPVGTFYPGAELEVLIIGEGD